MYKAIALAVVEKPQWHIETNWRHIDELYKYRPYLYKDWVERGIIPRHIVEEFENREEI